MIVKLQSKVYSRQSEIESRQAIVLIIKLIGIEYSITLDCRLSTVD